MRLVAVFCLLCVRVLLSCETALAGPAGSIQAILQRDGTGAMVANVPAGHAGEVWSWSVCEEDGSNCVPFGSGQSITTGSTAGGHVFVATETLSGATASSPVWRGPVNVVKPPGVVGAVRANALVTPVAATWSGGWSGDFDGTQLAACHDPAGTACTTLTSDHYLGGCPRGAAVIDPAFVGQYLRVADQTYGPNTLSTLYAVSSPYGDDVWVRGPTISVAIVGRVAPATGPRESTCGPPPLSEPVVTIKRRGVTMVRCSTACRIVVTIRRAARHVEMEANGHGERTIRPTRRDLTWLGPGSARITVSVNGRVLARRSVVLE